MTVATMVGDFSPYLTVDTGLNSAALVSLALELKDIRTEDMVFFTLPTAGA